MVSRKEKEKRGHARKILVFAELSEEEDKQLEKEIEKTAIKVIVLSVEIL
ncbi:MAG: hypothetical protein GTO45_18085 [Candidatus Aminicenantes bacterium]|nr:hypothetical protein [Candidatus Aminicenantes bacterium]NIM80695.1 hypothetical protein [Candidatus Aminicenantes bacterium]NIN20070.1 hypothetical protein [Candidatus Aminicenantes bacterium]NIN43857.1 hypothetical protein [Candidatus Aminicenantes bacterium]NIN86668.1 hypothetical protein [Candidatus Aminicenantes bacterium]